MPYGRSPYLLNLGLFPALKLETRRLTHTSAGAFDILPSMQPEDLSSIDRMLEAGDLEGAREALGRAPSDDESCSVVRIKLALYDGSLEAGPAMQQLIQLMRKRADFPGAKELYQEASTLAYGSRTSSVSHSHPPPPVDGDED